MKALFTFIWILSLALPKVSINPVLKQSTQQIETSPIYYQVINIDNVTIQVGMPFEVLGFVVSGSDEIIQMATTNNLDKDIELSIIAIPVSAPSILHQEFGEGIENGLSYTNSLQLIRNGQGAKQLEGHKISLFGQSVLSISNYMDIPTITGDTKKVVIEEWVFEYEDHVWLFRISQSESNYIKFNENYNNILINKLYISGNSISLKVLNQKASSNLSTTPDILASDLPSPSWWNGDCDVNNFPGSYPLGGSYRGVKACGPLNTTHLVSFGAGVSQYEWQCPELSKRYLYLAYGTPPYSANGKDVVNNYPGSNLEKVQNGTSGKGPIAGDVLSYGPYDTYGHTSVVSASNIDSNGNGTITIIEQNWSSSGTRTHNVSNWTVQASMAVSGWLHNPNNGNTVPLPSDTTWCANEGGRCNFSGTGIVYYGANNQYYYKENITNGIDCNNDNFGDPISGVTKACYYKITSGGSCNNPSPNSDQVGLYTDKNYCGTAKIFNTGEWANPGVMGFPNDSTYSVKVGSNVKAVLCKDDNYAGGCYEFTSDDADLTNNDIGSATSSLKVQSRIQVPGAPSLNSPANNATVGRYDNVVLSWNGVSGATEYYAEFTGGPGFSVNSGWTGSTSYTVGSTFWGGVYTWWVQARNSAGPGSRSEIRTLYRKYGTPSSLTASAASQSQINLSWGASADAPGNIDGYRIYRNGSAVATIGSSTTSYSDSGLSCGTSYSYTVKAYKGSLESDASNTASATTSGCQARVPTLQSPDNGAYFNEGQSIVLSWTDTGDEFYGEVTGGPSPMTFGWQTATSKDLGAQWAGYQYSWHVKARNSVSTSDYSANRTFIVRPGKPTSLVTSSPSCSRVNLTWSDNSGNEQGYQVYRNGNLIATLGSNVASYQDNSVGSGTDYSYVVYAYRGSIQSEPSDPAILSTSVCPPGNDNRSSAYTITSLPYTNTQSTRGATIESTEPVYPLGFELGASVWYKFTPGTTGIYSFDTQGSDYDTVIHIFALGASNNLTLLKGNDDDPVTHATFSKSIITLNAGTTYFISIAQYSNTYGGNLTFNVQSIPCGISSLCLTVTSPYYTGFSSNIQVYDQSNHFIEWAYTDDYGFLALDDLTAGSYKIVAAGANMVNVMESIPVPSIKYVTGIGLPSIKMELKDPSSNPIDNRLYVGNDMDIFYLGYNPVEWGSSFYLSPDTYTFYISGISSNVLAIKPYAITQQMNGTAMVYDLSQEPYETITYALDTFESVSLVTWVSNSFGFGFNTTNGMTTTISMPSDMELNSETVATVADNTYGGTWDYWFSNPGYLKLTQFREEMNIQIGGALKIYSYAYNSPYGFGDIAPITYGETDQYGNMLSYLQYNQPTGSSINTASSSNFRTIEGMVIKPDIAEELTQDSTIQTAPPAITFTTHIYDPSNQLMAQNIAGSSLWNAYDYTIPNPAVTGQWRVEVTANHLGSYQGTTTGSTTFEVKNTPPPSNDDIGSPIVITTKPYTNTQDTFGATQASDDPAMPMCNLNPAEATVWYRYTPVQSGVLSADTIGSDYDTVLAVWRGTRGNLTLVACNDDRSMNPHDQDSEIVADLTAGIPYYIMAGKWTSNIETTSLSIEKISGTSIQTMGAGTLQLHVDFLPSTPNAATLISPNSVLIHRTPTFVWSKASLATEYILSVWDQNAQQVYSYTVKANDVCQAEICDYTPNDQLENGAYTWQIQTHNSNGFGPIGTPMVFEIQSTEPTEKKVFIPFIVR